MCLAGYGLYNPDDNIVDMALVMNIIHCYLAEIPSTLSLEQLFWLTVFSDKFGTVRQLTRWVP